MPSSQIATKAKPLPRGVYCPVISLYKDTPRQEIDHDAMTKHCQYLVRGGLHGLVYHGTNGEAVLLSREERRDILKTVRRAIADLGIHGFPIVAGISGQSTNESIVFAEDAAAAGADFALLLPPSYWRAAVNEDVLLSFYREVADNSPIPIVVYNFPGVVNGVDLDSDQLAALAEHPNIVAVKLTCGNVGKVVRLTSKFTPEQFGVFGGSSDYLFPTLEAGGVGCVTGLANVFPKSTSQIYDLYTAGKKDEARELQSVVANSEWACKKGIAHTKNGAYNFVGKQLGLSKAAFSPRKPYKPVNDKVEEWVVQTMGVLTKDEARFSDAPKGSRVNGTQ